MTRAKKPPKVKVEEGPICPQCSQVVTREDCDEGGQYHYVGKGAKEKAVRTCNHCGWDYWWEQDKALIARMVPHPVCALFPMCSDEELTALAADIKANGQRDPIVYYQDDSDLSLAPQLLDGRNRIRACEMAEVRPVLEQYLEDADSIVSWILSKNVHRRHLTPGQRAVVAEELATGSHGGDRSKAQICALTQAEAAQRMGVSERTLQHVRRIRGASPELYEAIKRGELSVNAALEQLKKTAPPTLTTEEMSELIKAELQAGEVLLETVSARIREKSEVELPDSTWNTGGPWQTALQLGVTQGVWRYRQDRLPGKPIADTYIALAEQSPPEPVDDSKNVESHVGVLLAALHELTEGGSRRVPLLTAEVQLERRTGGQPIAPEIWQRVLTIGTKRGLWLHNGVISAGRVVSGEIWLPAAADPQPAAEVPSSAEDPSTEASGEADVQVLLQALQLLEGELGAEPGTPLDPAKVRKTFAEKLGAYIVPTPRWKAVVDAAISAGVVVGAKGELSRVLQASSAPPTEASAELEQPAEHWDAKADGVLVVHAIEGIEAANAVPPGYPVSKARAWGAFSYLAKVDSTPPQRWEGALQAAIAAGQVALHGTGQLVRIVPELAAAKGAQDPQPVEAKTTSIEDTDTDTDGDGSTTELEDLEEQAELDGHALLELRHAHPTLTLAMLRLELSVTLEEQGRLGETEVLTDARWQAALDYGAGEGWWEARGEWLELLVEEDEDLEEDDDSDEAPSERQALATKGEPAGQVPKVRPLPVQRGDVGEVRLLVMVSGPLYERRSGRVQSNMDRLDALVKLAVSRGYSPLAPYFLQYADLYGDFPGQLGDRAPKVAPEVLETVRSCTTALATAAGQLGGGLWELMPDDPTADSPEVEAQAKAFTVAHPGPSRPHSLAMRWSSWRAHFDAAGLLDVWEAA
jgi:hypothetical protein